MKGLNEFIIEIKEAFNQTIQSGELILHVDKNMSSLRASNRYGKVISIPLNFETAISEGDEVIVDPTVLVRQVYKGVEQESVYCVDRKKGWYRVPKDLVVLFRHESSEWFCYNQSTLLKPLEQKKSHTGLVQVVELNTAYNNKIAEVAYNNKEMNEQGVYVGDQVVIKPDVYVPYWINGNEYWCINNRNILALVA